MISETGTIEVAAIAEDLIGRNMEPPDGDLSSFSLSSFGLSEMIQCGRSIRQLGSDADSMEAAAGRLVRYLHKVFADPRTGEKSCALVRCFKTHRRKDLPRELAGRAAAMSASNRPAEADDVPCLTLLATAGDLPEWNDRSSSAGHAVMPLESVAMVERAPMIAQLIRQMGLEIGAVLAPTEELLVEAEERAYGVFHVEHAVGSAFIPAQAFVAEHGIQSVLGFGGLLPSGDLFAVIVFSRAPISREAAHLFRTIALSVKLVLLPFTRGPVFAGDEAVTPYGDARSREQEQVRSEIATLRLLIPALEDAAMHQTSRLEHVVSDLRMQAEEVRRLGLRLGSVLESTTDAVFMVDPQWRFTYLNRHAAALLQASGDLIGKNLWEEFPAAVGTKFWTNYNAAMRSRTVVEFEEYYPEPLDRWYEVHAFPNEEGIAVFFHDVTGKRKADAALIKNEKLAAVGRLAASIAHEINNPLESVTNLLYLAQISGDMQEVREFLAVADREVRRIGAITSQTLRFHRQSTSPMEVSCDEITGGVLSTYHGRIVNSNVTVELRSRARRPVLCFEGEIRQVVNNLVGNAIDAMHPGGGGRLLIRSREATDWKSGRRGLYLTVADTGFGMSPQIQAKSFEAFFTTKGMEGTGLGLWISNGIVDRHRGRILLKSSQKERHRGTVFTLFLPYDTHPVAAKEETARMN